jgi:predicted Zn-dependent protease with MMP-like domain
MDSNGRDAFDGDDDPNASSEPIDPAEAAFDALVDLAIGEIPEPFADQLNTVAFVVEDEPPPGQSPPGQVLLGLYSGVPRTAWGVDNVPVPSKISIFRGPHERLFRSPEARRRAVEETVFHETAHHFGISDDRLRELQASRARPNRN